MSHILSDILGVHESQLLPRIARLESGCGEPKIDIALMTELKVRSRAVISSLQLDPDDTVAEELYQALLAKCRTDEAAITADVGTHDVVPAITQRIASLLSVPLWVPKRSVMKALITECVPKQTMKARKYRSVASLVKNEPTNDILATAYHIEPDEWRTRFIHILERLNVTDFETRFLELTSFSDLKWQEYNLHPSRYPINALPELGVLHVMPISHELRPGELVALIDRVARLANDLAARSAFLQLAQISSNFGVLASTVYGTGVPRCIEIGGEVVPWYCVMQATNDQEEYATAFELRMHSEVFQPLSAPVLCAQLNDTSEWWQQNEALALLANDTVVSLTLGDAGRNLAAQAMLSGRPPQSAPTDIWKSMLVRYAAQPAYAKHIIKQLDNFLLTFETNSGNGLKKKRAPRKRPAMKKVT